MRLCLVFVCDCCALFILLLLRSCRKRSFRPSPSTSSFVYSRTDKKYIVVYRWWWVRESELLAPCRGLHEESPPPPRDVAMEITQRDLDRPLKRESSGSVRCALTIAAGNSCRCSFVLSVFSSPEIHTHIHTWDARSQRFQRRSRIAAVTHGRTHSYPSELARECAWVFPKLGK